MRRWPALAVALALLATACSGDDDADPRPERRVTTTTAAIDRSGIALARVPGETTTTIRETGSARLVGTVRGPQGLVPGATVRIERLVGGREVRTDVTTGPDGRFVLDGAPGGRYRVRAFAPPALAQLEADVRFLADAAEHAFDLVVDDHSGLVVRASAAPDAPVVGVPVNLVVQVAQRRVDQDGVVRTAGIPSLSVELTGLGRWVLRDDAQPSADAAPAGSSSRVAAARTDDGGRARFELRCAAPGPPGLAVRVPVAAPAPSPSSPPSTATAVPTTAAAPTVETVALDLPTCAEAPTTTTTATGSSTTGAAPASTTEGGQ